LDLVLKDQIKSLEESIISKNIKLETNIEDNIIVKANNNLTYALKYLIDGAQIAVDYYDPSQRKISISLTKEENVVRLEIFDTAKISDNYHGVGIERGKEGGILYFVARRIVDDHKGKMEMFSPDKEIGGTRFVITLPLA